MLQPPFAGRNSDLFAAADLRQERSVDLVVADELGERLHAEALVLRSATPRPWPKTGRRPSASRDRQRSAEADQGETGSRPQSAETSATLERPEALGADHDVERPKQPINIVDIVARAVGLQRPFADQALTILQRIEKPLLALRMTQAANMWCWAVVGWSAISGPAKRDDFAVDFAMAQHEPSSFSSTTMVSPLPSLHGQDLLVAWARRVVLGAEAAPAQMRNAARLSGRGDFVMAAGPPSVPGSISGS